MATEKLSRCRKRPEPRAPKVPVYRAAARYINAIVSQQVV